NAHGTNSVHWAEIRKVLGGTTSMAGSGGAAGFARNLDRTTLHEGDGLPTADLDTFPLGDSSGNFRSGCSWDYGVDAYDASLADAYVPHVAVGIDAYAAEEFRCLSDAVAGGVDVTEPNAAHVHGIGLHTVDYDQMARSGTTLIWSPRSDLQLYGETARVTTFAALGGRVALGSDWVATGSIHPGRELACADAFNRDYLDGAFTDRELWWMATRDAAFALGGEDRVGALAAGHLADIAVFGGAAAAGNPWRAVIEADTLDVALVLRGGVPLYGEPAAVAALGRACEALTVCETDRVLCAEPEIGQTYAALEAAVAGNYPAFFCDGPPIGEPVCVPTRDEWSGARTAEDADGDAVPDAADLCPAVFDPVRPMDDGAQSDLDGDGLGDACDPDPVPPDLDGDGADNAADNCPYTANADQADADIDGHGDVCDACPDVPNPGTVCPS
ncbi:MAG: thrombospondin type 3 repeat-containing protein, partial [Myxococcota bacterium]